MDVVFGTNADMENTAINNYQMFNAAKKFAEPFVLSYLRRRFPTSTVWAGNQFDDRFGHTDLFIKTDRGISKIDVKNLDPTSIQFNRKTFVISDKLVKNVIKDPTRYNNHYIACIEYKSGKPSGNVLFYYTKEILPCLVKKTKDGNMFWLLDTEKTAPLDITNIF